MKAIGFRMSDEALTERLGGFHRRTEIDWLGLQGRFERPGSASVRFTRYEPGYLGGGGRDALNGGLIATGFDAVCVLAALGHTETEVVATLTLQVQYLRIAARSPALRFEAHAVKVARNVVFVHAALVDDRQADELIASANATLAPLRPKASSHGLPV